jgi:hypothetical protein
MDLFEARARITVVTVCEPALPPVPMSKGMKKESDTTAWAFR